MISIEREQLGDISLLHVAEEKVRDQLNQPAIFFFHGLTSAKDQNLHIAYHLAEEGYRVILPDALHHGEREGTVTGEQRTMLLWEIVMNSINELQQLKDHFTHNGLIDEKRIGVAGTSMGGITTYGALTQYPWIHTSATLMGTAYYEHFANQQIEQMRAHGISIPDTLASATLKRLAAFDLSKQLSTLSDRPLMIWHGEKDQIVPASYSTTLYNELVPNYSDRPDHLALYLEKETGHAVSRQAIFQMKSWFTKHML
ncbi:esterase [Alkalicoccobacillus porphyridii]|uniref:Esterase n=1 Tax=Alkalicoccobacillus porphyridii TaxID=2597270 RepID=A0A553ZXH9_9BACI|nr:esterase [Alkalicoccobacillus porphyridii]TSB46159.1 esterase [Alkalicoccobacillus porphyridii]